MLSQLISLKIQQYTEEKQKEDITIARNRAASSFRFASLASGAHQTFTGVE